MTSTWQGDLQVTGSNLKWDKSEWCSIDFVWNSNGQWRYKEPDESPGDIWIKDPSRADVVMQWKGTGDTKVAVGATQAADGSMDGQMEFMLEKIKEFGKVFKESWVPQKLAWMGLRTMIWPSFAFPLAACTFSLEEAEELTKELCKLTISKLGIVRSFPHVFLHAPLCI